MGGEVELKNQIHKDLAAMGEEPYHCAPPTGYRDTAETWVNPGAMVSRLNFSLKLASNRIDGVFAQLPHLNKSELEPLAFIHQVEKEILPAGLSQNSQTVVLNELEQEGRTMADGEVRPLSLAKVTALILGSPEFQRR